MLEWDTNKLIKIINNNSMLHHLVNQAKNALKNAPFKPHMTWLFAQNLNISDQIDFRFLNDEFVHSTIEEYIARMIWSMNQIEPSAMNDIHRFT